MTNKNYKASLGVIHYLNLIMDKVNDNLRKTIDQYAMLIQKEIDTYELVYGKKDLAIESLPESELIRFTLLKLEVFAIEYKDDNLRELIAYIKRNRLLNKMKSIEGVNKK